MNFFLIFKRRYWGFIKGHNYLNENGIVKLQEQLCSGDDRVRDSYSDLFVSSLGEGQGFPLASGRMAFYLLMQTMDIKKDDEVILTGFTCSVMVNAVIKIGAKPVFSDVAPGTYGSSAISIRKAITQKTKLIVAQHTFGIPCEIDEIQKIARDNNCYLIEDCALSFGSSYKGIKLGNWGDAALFSTDHSKPINTLIGGFLYTNRKEIYTSAKRRYDDFPELSPSHQQNIFKQIVLESKYCTPKRYAQFKTLQTINYVFSKLIKKHKTIFLENDSSSNVSEKELYPYPAKMPHFLCYLGIQEFTKWNVESVERKNILDGFVSLFADKSRLFTVPKCYYDSYNSVIPLRFVFQCHNEELIKELNSFLDTSWFWFKEPIIATKNNLSEFGYLKGTCPIAEEMGKTIVNLPCFFIEHYEELIMELKKIINKYQ
jgi:hypothetical protein